MFGGSPEEGVKSCPFASDFCVVEEWNRVPAALDSEGILLTLCLCVCVTRPDGLSTSVCVCVLSKGKARASLCFPF